MRASRGNEFSRIRRSFQLEREIERLLSDGQYALAVILSQTLLELRTAAEIDNLIEGFDAGPFGHAATGLLSSQSPFNPKTREFLEVALGTKLPAEMPEAWERLSLHNRRRNAIIHEGATASEVEARESLAAVEDVSWRLRQLVLRRIGWDAELEEDERIKREEEGLPPEGEDDEIT